MTAHAQVSEAHGGIDMMTCALVEFPDGVSLLLQCGMWTADEDSLRILGSKGRIEVPSAFFAPPGARGVHRAGREHPSATSRCRDVDHYTVQADRLARRRAVRIAAAVPGPGPGAGRGGAGGLRAVACAPRSRVAVSIPGVRG